MEKPYPLRLEAAPIVEAIVEIRFSSSLPADAVFGVIYAELKGDYPSHKQLPVMQLPSDVRLKDPNLMYQPQYQLSGESPLIIGVGPKTLSISYVKYNMNAQVEYPGWTKYMSTEANRIIQLILQSLSDIKLERLGIRYQDFFEGINIVEGIEPTIEFPRRKMENLMIKTAIIEEEMVHNITISNDATINIQNGTRVTVKNGSIVDIDTILNNIGEVDIEETLTDVHDANKNLFYELLERDFIDKFGAIYPNDEH